VLFDAIEFDEKIATIDDALRSLPSCSWTSAGTARRARANVVLNRYLWRSQADLDLIGLQALAALPRAARGHSRHGDGRSGGAGRSTSGGGRPGRARAYVRAALQYAAPNPPQLVAVGGLSGTGKSTLAAALAPGLGAAPGAVHLRSDLERKTMFGVAETVRLPAEAYSTEASHSVYDLLCRKACLALVAGQSVVVDAVHARPDERSAIESVASDLGCRSAACGLRLRAASWPRAWRRASTTLRMRRRSSLPGS
jgi:predicted kinase